MAPADVKPVSGPLYAEDTMRTLFFDFENHDWEKELEEFHNTDVEVPAKLTVDGKEYPGVGVHFRGASSYFMARTGQKRSLNVSLDFTEKKQRLDGYKTLNLLNSHGDASMLSSVIYSHIARQFIPAPKANFVRVVINGESWGVFVSVQQFNKDFVEENFHTAKGARWKVKGSPGGGGGLEYLGDKIEDYKRRYDMKDGDDDDWRALITLCKTLKETPPDALEAALKPLVDLDGLLWFLALDCALMNSDGYWVRASDYSIYRDKTGRFHFIPHDMNEAFRIGGGPGMGGGRGGRGGFGDRARESRDSAAAPADAPAAEKPDVPRGENPPAPKTADAARSDAPVPAGDASRPPAGFPPGGFPGGGQRVSIELDPLTGLDDATKPLRSKVFAVPALRERYLANVRTIAEKWLDWKTIGPLVAQYRALIDGAVEADTRKSGSLEAFRKLTADEPPTAAEASQPRRGPDAMPLRTFAEKRREYLLRGVSAVQK